MTELTLDQLDAATADRSTPVPVPVPSKPGAGARIDVTGVGYHAGRRHILDDVSFSVEPGELVALAGASGAGKTTLLEILAGLRVPSAGQIMHDGVRVDAGAMPGSGVGYVPQDDIIHLEMPLRRTLQYGCDKVVFLARGGRVAFAGTPSEARRYFGVDDLAGVYDVLAGEDTPRAWAERPAGRRGPAAAPTRTAPGRGDRRPPGFLRQWWLLTRRNAEVLVRNRLTLAILLGSPVLVTAMMSTLFQPGALTSHGAAGIGSTQIVFWMAFAGFFFGLTYGLLQIVGETAVLRRELRSGLSVSAYVAAKIGVLLPVLAAVTLVLVGVLRVLDRLPAAGWDVYGSLLGTLMIEAVSALALGLLASAGVSNAAQAALALPMLCFPQVLFAGAIVPVADMAAPGRLLSLSLATRYSFEALGRGLRLDRFTGTVPGMRAYDATFAGTVAHSWLVLASFTAVFALATVWVLHRRFRPGKPG